MKKYGLLWYLWGYKLSPLRGLRFWWNQRGETIEQRELRLEASRKRFRALYSQHCREMEFCPDSRQSREVRAIMDTVMDRVLGPEEKAQNLLDTGKDCA